MTTQSVLVDRFCWIYSLLLYTYPPDFRRRFGGEMRQVFRDRCREVARRPEFPRLIAFALSSAADVVASTVREQSERFASAVAFHAVGVWSAGRKRAPRGFVSEWLLTILMYLFATTTLVQAYVVPTGSMEGNLRIGDHILVDRVTFANPGGETSRLLPYREVQRGDIVAFHYPEDVRQTYVKRVIGLPGDRIRLENKQVIRNGRRLVEPYTQHTFQVLDSYRDNFPQPPGSSTTPRGCDMLQNHVVDGEVLVPPNTVFVLGDNRDNSLDSRYWGFVPREYVVGKPLVVYWSYDAPTSDLEEWNWNHIVDVVQHFFTKTRWDRTLLVPRSQAAREVDR